MKTMRQSVISMMPMPTAAAPTISQVTVHSVGVAGGEATGDNGEATGGAGEGGGDGGSGGGSGGGDGGGGEGGGGVSAPRVQPRAHEPCILPGCLPFPSHVPS